MRGIIVIDDKAIEEKVRLIEDKLVEVHKLAHGRDSNSPFYMQKLPRFLRVCYHKISW